MSGQLHTWQTIMQTQSVFSVSDVLVLTPLMTVPSLNMALAHTGYRGSGRFEDDEDYRGSGRVTIQGLTNPI